MEKVGIFYGSSTGNTESVAQMIQEQFGADAEVFDIADADIDQVKGYTNIIFGCSTWGVGDLQDDFEEFIENFEGADLNGKAVAIFGCGDQESYADSFVDAIGEIYEALEGTGCDLVGKISTDGYEYDESRAEKDGKFVGLAIDEDNQSDETADRVSAWVEQLKNEFK